MDRIGSPFDEIHLHNMLPDAQLDESLDLTSRLGDRIQAMHDIIGLDNRILSDSEKLNPAAIGAIYDDKTLPESEDEFEELTINQRAISLLQHIKSTEETLWQTITELPDVIRSALAVQDRGPESVDQPQAGETIVMMAANDATRCYAVGDDLNPRPIRPTQVITAAECLPGTPAEALPEKPIRE